MQKDLRAHVRTAQQAIQLQHERYTTGSDSGQGLTRTVPREYTHRAAVAEVFLTDWKPGRSDGFLVHAQWPRGHSFFAPRAGFQDPMLVAESFRQAGALIAHAELGVPLGHSFMMRGLSYTATPEGLAADLVPTEVELEVTCPEQSWRGGKFTGMRYEATLLRDGRSIGFAEAAFSCLSPEVYRRLRGDRPTSAPPAEGRRLDPASVGRAHQGDVVLLEPEGAVPRWRLYVDTLHPILFDHPVDHVPGMVLMEAARQAAQAVHPMPVLAVAMESTFSRYAELDAPCWIEAETTPSVTDGPALVHVRAVQNDSTVFTAQVTTWHL